MARFPVLGRLFWYVMHGYFPPLRANQRLTKVPRREYIALLGSLILVFLEGFISIITLALRKALYGRLCLHNFLIAFSPANHSILL